MYDPILTFQVDNKTKMSSVNLASLGSPSEVLQVTTQSANKALGPSQVLIKMKVRPVNPADVFSILGVYPGFTPSSFPCTPGLEGMGVVSQVGSGVSGFAVGDRVVPFMPPYVQSGCGTWQDFLVIDQKDLVVCLVFYWILYVRTDPLWI